MEVEWPSSAVGPLVPPVPEGLTLILGAEAPQLVVAVGGEVQPEPVLAADDGGGKVRPREPEDTQTAPL